MNKLGIRSKDIRHIRSPMRIDLRLKEFAVEFGLHDACDKSDYTFEDGTTMLVQNKFNPLYWRRVAHLLEMEDIEFILSFQQAGVWNIHLYREAEKRRDNHIERILGL